MIPDSLFSPPQRPFFFSSKSLFRPPQSPVFDLSKSRFFFLRVHFPSSPSSFLLSKSSPILPDSRSHPLRPLPSSQSPLPSSYESRSRPPRFPFSSSPIPLPSSSEPKKTAERHEAVPPFSWWLVVGSKTEHSSPSPPLLGTIQTREPLRWRSRLLLLRPIWRRPHWCQG